MEVLSENRSTTRLLPRLLYAFLVLALMTGCVYLLVQNRRLAVDKLKPEKSFAGEQVAVFFAEPQPAGFKIKPVLCTVKPGGDKHVKALRMLFAGPARASKLAGLFPQDTRVLNFSLKDGLATVNLNYRAAQLNVGSALEALAVASIVNTLTKFPDVYRVKILIEGRETESLAGHVDLSGELRYTDIGVDPVPQP